MSRIQTECLPAFLSVSDLRMFAAQFHLYRELEKVTFDQIMSEWKWPDAPRNAAGGHCHVMETTELNGKVFTLGKGSRRDRRMDHGLASLQQRPTNGMRWGMKDTNSFQRVSSFWEGRLRGSRRAPTFF
jgi:hypothetical protein